MPLRAKSSRLEPYLSARDISTLWAYLHRDLERVGFQKVFYVCTQRRPANGEFTVRDAIVHSSYGAEFDRYFVEGGAYASDITTQWAINSQGAISWSLSRRLNRRGQVTPKQREVHERSLALGIVNGYTVSLRTPRSTLVSGFGLCAGDETTQTRVDRTWLDHGDEVLLALSAFDICARAIPQVRAEEELSKRQREVLEWAGDGKTIDEIADIMDLHRNTVAKHMQEARQRLGVANTVQAVLRAALQGQIYR